MRRALILALALLAVLPAGASAHATLVGTSPERGAVTAGQPEQVSFRFSESVEAAFGAVRVYDAQAEQVDDGQVVRPARGGSESVAVGLRSDLPDGSYTATYRVISADGHPVSGGLVFSVGQAGAGPSQSVSELIGEDGAGPVTEWSFNVVRAVAYAAIALVLGVLVFVLACWGPALRRVGGAGSGWTDASEAVARRSLRVLTIGVACGLVAGVISVWLYAATAAGRPAFEVLNAGAIADALETRTGRAYGLRVGVLSLFGLALGAVALRGGLPVLRPATLGATGAVSAAGGLTRGAAGVLLVLGGLLAVAPALGGHAGVTDPVALMVGLDMVHLVAMAVWIGGIVALLWLVAAATRRIETTERSRLLAAVLERFSPIALLAVLALAVTGTIQAVVQIEAFGDVLGTGYGRAIVIKAVLLAGLIGLGAMHRRRSLPALRALAADGQAPGGPGVLLRRLLRAEVALLAAVLVVTGALVGLSPSASAAGGPFSERVELGPLTLEATLDPAAPGPNEMHLYLYDEQGAPFTGTEEITATFEQEAEQIGPLDVTLRAAGPGHYVADTVALAPGGTWTLDVSDRVSEFDAYETSIEVDVR